jgi:hypothetical protein
MLSLPQLSTAASSSSIATPAVSTPAPPWKIAAIPQTGPLASLPTELHKEIFSHLPVTDFSALRAVCQEWRFSRGIAGQSHAFETM